MNPNNFPLKFNTIHHKKKSNFSHASFFYLFFNRFLRKENFQYPCAKIHSHQITTLSFKPTCSMKFLFISFNHNYQHEKYTICNLTFDRQYPDVM